MKKRIFSILLCVALLAGILAVPGLVSTAATMTNDKGTYEVVDAAPNETPLNRKMNIWRDVSLTNKIISNSNSDADTTVAALATDGVLNSLVGNTFATDSARGAWTNCIVDLGASYMVNRLLFSWDAGSTSTSGRPVYLKFYAAESLNDLLSDASLIAAKDEIPDTDKHILLTGAATQARYVAMSTYVPAADGEDLAKYGSWNWHAAGTGTIKIAELAFYEAPDDGTGGATVGKYEVLTAAPTDTPLNRKLNVYKDLALSSKFVGNGTNNNYAETDGTGSDIATDGKIDTLVTGVYAETATRGAWTNAIVNLGESYMVDRLFFSWGSQSSTSGRPVHLKFYASTSLDNLLSDASLIAEKDGINDTERHILLTGKATKAQYVAMSTYVPADTTEDTEKYGAWSWHSSAAQQLKVAELAFYAAEPAIDFLGAQVRGTDALRFGFEMTATGVDFASDPATTGTYDRVLTNATMTVSGKAYTLVDFGAIVSTVADLTLTMDAVDDNKTKMVSAQRLYSDEGDVTKYSAVVTGVPSTALDRSVYARAYAQLSDGVNTFYVYGAQVSRTVNGTLQNAGVL